MHRVNNQPPSNCSVSPPSVRPTAAKNQTTTASAVNVGSPTSKAHSNETVLPPSTHTDLEASSRISVSSDRSPSPSCSGLVSVSDAASSRASSPSHSHPSSPSAAACSPSPLLDLQPLCPLPFNSRSSANLNSFPHAPMTESMYTSAAFSSSERYLPSEWNDTCSAAAAAESLAFARLLLEQEAKLAAGRLPASDLLAQTLTGQQYPFSYPQQHSLPYAQNLAYLLHSHWLPLDHYNLDSSSRDWFAQQQKPHSAGFVYQSTFVSSNPYPTHHSAGHPTLPSRPPRKLQPSSLTSQAATFAIAGNGTVSASEDSIPLLKFVGLDPGRSFKSCVHPQDWDRTASALESIRSGQLPCTIVDAVHLRACSKGSSPAHGLCAPLDCVADAKDCSCVLGKLCITSGGTDGGDESAPAFLRVLSLTA